MAALLIMQAHAARQMQRQRVFRDRSSDLDTLNDIQLISRYRFPRASILELTDLVSGDITRPTSRSSAIPAHIQMMVTLRFLAKGDFQSEVGDALGISTASVSRCITKVCESVCRHLDNIKLPSTVNEVRNIKEEFHQIAGMPNVVGAIDCTLIPIQGISGDNEKDFVCRKGFHSLNIQAVCDAKLRFLNINCKYAGSTHDAYVLMSSYVPEAMADLPDGGWLLGDSGYPLKTWLMTPMNHPTTPQEILYNKAHCRTRAVVERAFGVLKSRFRCIHKTGGSLPYTPVKCCKIIETAFRLHNKATMDRIPLQNGGQIVNMCHNHTCTVVPTTDALNLRRRVISKF